MALKFNGTDIRSVIFNNVSLNKVIFNGTTVWQRLLDILSVASTYFGTWAVCAGTTSFGSSMVITTGKDGMKGYTTVTYKTKKGIDLTNFNTLTITGTEVATVYDGPANVNVYIKMSNSSGTTTLFTKESRHNGAQTFPISISKDISSLKGEYTFTFEIYYYCKEDNVKITINKFELS